MELADRAGSVAIGEVRQIAVDDADAVSGVIADLDDQIPPLITVWLQGPAGPINTYRRATFLKADYLVPPQ